MAATSRRGLVWVVVLAVTIMLGISPVIAHSEIRQQSPAVGQTVGGDVSHIDFLYWTPIRDGSVQIEGPDGPVSGIEIAISPNNLVLSADFPALSTAGAYTVTRTELSVDGDEVTSKFGFIYDPNSPLEVLSLVARDSGPNWGILGGLLVFVGLAGFLLWPGRR